MDSLKLNKRNSVRKGLFALMLIVLLVSALILSVTARYMTSGRATATFVPVIQHQSLHLFSGRDVNGIGEPLEMVERAMQFLCVSNAESQDTFEICEDMTFRVRLYLKQTDELTEPLKVSMQNGRRYGDWGQEIEATSRKLNGESALAKVSGNGWIYTFCDASGEELTFTLSGGELSDLYFVFTTENGMFNQFQLKVEPVRARSEVAQ